MLAVPWKIPDIELSETTSSGDIICINTELERFNSESFIELDKLKQDVGVYKIEKGESTWKKAVLLTDSKVNMPLTIPNPINRAYYKLVEIFRTCIVTSATKSFHLCEAPGGFVQAVYTEMKNSIKQVYCASMIGKDFPYFNAEVKRLGAEVLEFKNNDIIDDEVKAYYYKEVGQHSCDLITADGAIDNDLNPDTNEKDNIHLFRNQVITAMNLQKQGGTFIVKIFGMRLHITCQMIAVLTHMYENVHIVKPLTSRGVNDERYIVCQGFNVEKKMNICSSNTTEIVKLKPDWLNEVLQISLNFATMQKQKLRHALCVDTNEYGKGKGKGRGRQNRGRGRGRYKPY